MDGIGTYENYNHIRYRGWEAALYWSDRIGNVKYTVGGSISTLRGKYLRYSENVVYDYQRVTGTATGSYRGYVCLGKFTSQEEIETSPRQLFDDEVQVGDLKYADLNDDGLIDSNDTRVIGNTPPPVRLLGEHQPALPEFRLHDRRNGPGRIRHGADQHGISGTAGAPTTTRPSCATTSAATTPV
ncbi:MAG: hypothetical protein V8Q54_04555 [Alistipes senegalensis]